MPKMKTCKAIAKRVKVTAGGKVIRFGIGRRHLLSTKSANRKRHLRKATQISGAYVKKIKQALTYL